MQELRENYTKMALLMFHPFRTIDDIQTDGSFWKKYKSQLDMKGDKARVSQCTFWIPGFEILQKFQDQITLQKQLSRARDPIVLQTKCKKPEKGKNACNPTNVPQIPDISEFLTQFE